MLIIDFEMLQNLKIFATTGSELLNKHSNRAAVIPYIIKNIDSDNSEIWFLMGIHKKTKEITDFGGGVKKGENDLSAALRELHEETRDIFKDTITTTDNFLNCISVSTTQTNTKSKLCKKNEYYPLLKGKKIEIKKEENFKIVSKINASYGMSVIFLPIGEEWFETAESLFKSTLDDVSYRKDKFEKFNPNFCYPNEELSEIIWIKESSFVKLINISFEKNKDKELKMWFKLQKFYSSIYNKNIKQSLYEKWIDKEKFTLLHTNEE